MLMRVPGFAFWVSIRANLRFAARYSVRVAVSSTEKTSARASSTLRILLVYRELRFAVQYRLVPPVPSESFVICPSSKLIKPWYVIAAALAVAAYTTALYWLAIPALVILLWAGVKHAALRFTKLIISGDKLRHETGILSRSTRTMELRKVQDVRVDQSLPQRLIGTGNITLETAGETSRLTMKHVDSPQEVADRILRAAKH